MGSSAAGESVETAAASQATPQPRNWAAIAIAGLITLALALAIFLPLANHSLERAEPAKAYLRKHFERIRNDPKAAATEAAADKPNAERETAYAAIGRSATEKMPWLPTVIGSEMTETIYCLEITLVGDKEEKLSVIVTQRWSDDKSSSTMKILGMSMTRTCECGENLEMGCMLN